MPSFHSSLSKYPYNWVVETNYKIVQRSNVEIKSQGRSVKKLLCGGSLLKSKIKRYIIAYLGFNILCSWDLGT
jgi:hypothetical protein